MEEGSILLFVATAPQFHPSPVGAEKEESNEEQRTLAGAAEEAAIFRAFFLVAAPRAVARETSVRVSPWGNPEKGYGVSPNRVDRTVLFVL